jgi:RimJ/RimL family protein N-acetyltransferase
VSVRAATPADARAIAEVTVETWRATYVGVFPQAILDELDVDARERMWRSFAGSDRGGMFVAERDKRIIGFVSVGPSRDPEGIGELYAIYVVPGAWGTGAGLALMEEGVGWLREHYTEAVLWVATENPRARRFYERYGWAVDGTRTDVVEGVEVPEVRYRLSGLDRL